MSDETIHIRFVFSKEARKKRLKWKDLKIIEKLGKREEVPLEKVQTLAARFMADDQGEYLPFEQAMEFFDELTEEEASDALTQFADIIRESALPNVSAGLSEPTLPASSPTPTNSPDGSV